MTIRKLSETHFASIAELVRSRTGLSFTDSRRQHAEAGIRLTMAASDAADPGRFVALLHASDRAFQALVENLTVAETYFFREREQFEALRRLILPDLRRRTHERRSLRLWSAGCATGEEPYSLAILLEQEGLAGQASILGTDISRPAIARARKATYGAWSLRDSPPELIDQYFHRHGEKVTLIDRIRRAVQFDTFNLASPTYPARVSGTAGLDLILCRNVMIYFDSDTIGRVAQQMLASLKDGGWLITGPSDPPLWPHAAFETVLTPAGVLYRRCVAARGQSAGIKTRAPVLPQVDVTTREATPASPAQPAQVAAPLKSQAPRRTVKSGISGASPSQTEPAPLECCLSDLQALASLRDPQRTAAAVTAALEIHPLAPEIHYFQAIVLMSAGHYDEAAAALRRAIYLDRSMAVAHFALGSILQRRGLIAQAQRSYRNVLAVCDQRRADEIVPCSDGAPTGRLIEAARTQLARIAHSTGSPP